MENLGACDRICRRLRQLSDDISRSHFAGVLVFSEVVFCSFLEFAEVRR